MGPKSTKFGTFPCINGNIILVFQGCPDHLDTFALSTICRQCQSGSAECSLVSLGNFYTSDHESYMREKFVGTMKSFRKNISRKKYSRPWRWWLQMSRQMCARNIFFFWQQNLLFSTIFTFLHRLKKLSFFFFNTISFSTSFANARKILRNEHESIQMLTPLVFFQSLSVHACLMQGRLGCRA